MNSDIRIAIGFFDHPKTIKLQRRCGLEGVVSLLRLWEWAAQNRPSGELTGLDKEDIEIAAKWQGEEGKFFDSICELHFIDMTGEKACLHDWAETNSWVASSEDRADKGRLNRMKSTNKDVYELLTEAGRVGISKEEYGLITSSKDKLRATQALLKGGLSDATSPGPTPTPTPTPMPSPTPIPTPNSGGSIADLKNLHLTTCGLNSMPPLGLFRDLLAKGKTVKDIIAVYNYHGGDIQKYRQRNIVEKLEALLSGKEISHGKKPPSGGIYETPKSQLDGYKPPHVIELERLAREREANAG